MAGTQGREPSSRFCDIINVGRKERGQRIRPHDVTIFYKVNSGRGGKSRLKWHSLQHFDAFTLRKLYFKINNLFFHVLEFEVQGGIIFDSTQRYGRHTITVVAARGYTFVFTRDSGGGK